MTHRKTTFLFAVLALAMMASRLSAQIALQFETEKPRYLCYEPVHVHLTVSNLSGNTLIFDRFHRRMQERFRSCWRMPPLFRR